MAKKLKKILPKNKRDILAWLNNFLSKITPISKAAGISDAQNAAVLASSQLLVNAMAALVVAMATQKKATAVQDQVIDDLDALLVPLVMILMSSSIWSDALAKDLGIGSTTIASINANTHKATIKATVAGDAILLTLGKKGVKANNVYTKLQTDASFVFVETVLGAKYYYRKPLAVKGVAEIRQFMCRAVKNGAETGLQSDIVTVTFGG